MPDRSRPITAPAPPSRAAFFVSDSTGITAETLGNALLANFAALEFRRVTMPFITTREAARSIAARTHAEAQQHPVPILFSTVKDPEIRSELARSTAVIIDLFDPYLSRLEAAFGTTADEQSGQYHQLGDPETYFARMRAVEFAIEHDDGQSSRALDRADAIIVAPSRCGKTPATMYLALQYGLQVANYPLTDDDFPTEGLPPMISEYADRCFGLTTSPLRLSQVRTERRPNSRYASLPQCTLELRRAEELYQRHAIPFLNTSAKSVEEMSAIILQSLSLRS